MMMTSVSPKFSNNSVARKVALQQLKVACGQDTFAPQVTTTQFGMKNRLGLLGILTIPVLLLSACGGKKPEEHGKAYSDIVAEYTGANRDKLRQNINLIGATDDSIRAHLELVAKYKAMAERSEEEIKKYSRFREQLLQDQNKVFGIKNNEVIKALGNGDASASGTNK